MREKKYIDCPRCGGSGLFQGVHEKSRCNECIGVGKVGEDRYHPRHYTSTKSDGPH